MQLSLLNFPIFCNIYPNNFLETVYLSMKTATSSKKLFPIPCGMGLCYFSAYEVILGLLHMKIPDISI